jgi:L-lactate dehydrogenase complex protein LldG
MIDSTVCRREVLGAIRKALRTTSSEELRLQELAELRRDYIREASMAEAERTTLFEERVREYDGTVQRSSAANMAQAVAERLQARSKSRLAIPLGLPSAWLPTGFHFRIADDLAHQALDKLDGVITGCSVAIAQTGTIVLQHGQRQGPRKLTLIPDYHLCIVFAHQIVETLPQAFERLAAHVSLPTTFVSGPSATSDIEMTRIKGVHGPRTLDVLVIE